MLYESTRGSVKGVPSAGAIKMGIAEDRGLFTPESIPSLSQDDIRDMAGMNYGEGAAKILSMFLTDYTKDEINMCVTRAYSSDKFDTPEIAPLYKLDDNAYILELWHGPTFAFKDMALQILPHLLVTAVEKTGEDKEIVILVATSGDTGKAALEGFRDVPGTRIIVFYPDEGVSEIQKAQMATQEGRNVHVIAVRGNFDDAQTGVKNIFTDRQINALLEQNNMSFSSANSINWGRLVPQIVYYVSSYVDMLRKGIVQKDEEINIVVPTGNFGNILAAYYAKIMGVPVNKLICASNKNNVLTDFIRTGTYDRDREFFKTISPSMDILISSNLERLLFELTDHDSDYVVKLMSDLSTYGRYEVSSELKEKLQEAFWAEYATEEETLQCIKKVYEATGYVIDTHTAVAMDVYEKYKSKTGDTAKTLVASTASPYKFNASVVRAILGDEGVSGKSEFELLHVLHEISGMPIPKELRELESKAVLHKTKCSPDEMSHAVLDVLRLNT